MASRVVKGPRGLGIPGSDGVQHAAARRRGGAVACRRIRENAAYASGARKEGRGGEESCSWDEHLDAAEASSWTPRSPPAKAASALRKGLALSLVSLAVGSRALGARAVAAPTVGVADVARAGDGAEKLAKGPAAAAETNLRGGYDSDTDLDFDDDEDFGDMDEADLTELRQIGQELDSKAAASSSSSSGSSGSTSSGSKSQGGPPAEAEDTDAILAKLSDMSDPSRRTDPYPWEGVNTKWMTDAEISMVLPPDQRDGRQYLLEVKRDEVTGEEISGTLELDLQKGGKIGESPQSPAPPRWQASASSPRSPPPPTILFASMTDPHLLSVSLCFCFQSDPTCHRRQGLAEEVQGQAPGADGLQAGQAEGHDLLAVLDPGGGEPGSEGALLVRQEKRFRHDKTNRSGRTAHGDGGPPPRPQAHGSPHGARSLRSGAQRSQRGRGLSPGHHENRDSGIGGPGPLLLLQ